MPKKTIIYNPFARSEKAGILWYQLYKVARKCKIKLTKRAGHATRKAAQAVQNGSPLVIAAGGDGTINEVINGLVGSDVPLGIVPVGSVNVLARELGLPLDIPGAWSIIEKGYTQSFDLVRIDCRCEGVESTRYFIQLAGIGLDARIVQQVTWEKKMKWGPLSYVFETLRSIQKPLPRIKISIDGSPVDEAAFVLVGNGRYYGGPVAVFKQASMQDGFLDICLFESSGYLDILYYLQAILRGVQDSTRGIRYLQGKSLTLTSNAPVPVEIDGEYFGELPARITIIPNGIRIVVPQKT